MLKATVMIINISNDISCSVDCHNAGLILVDQQNGLLVLNWLAERKISVKLRRITSKQLRVFLN